MKKKVRAVGLLIVGLLLLSSCGADVQADSETQRTPVQPSIQEELPTEELFGPQGGLKDEYASPAEVARTLDELQDMRCHQQLEIQEDDPTATVTGEESIVVDCGWGEMFSVSPDQISQHELIGQVILEGTYDHEQILYGKNWAFYSFPLPVATLDKVSEAKIATLEEFPLRGEAQDSGDVQITGDYSEDLRAAGFEPAEGVMDSLENLICVNDSDSGGSEWAKFDPTYWIENSNVGPDAVRIIVAYNCPERLELLETIIKDSDVE